jgi:hypothetical protein
MAEGLNRPSKSSRQALATLGTAASQHVAAADGRHARAETVAALADEFARLVSTFHGVIS